MTAAMAAEHGGERRRDARIPAWITTTVFMGRRGKEATVHHPSAAGAYLTATDPLLEGSRLGFEIPRP